MFFHCYYVTSPRLLLRVSVRIAMSVVMLQMLTCDFLYDIVERLAETVHISYMVKVITQYIFA